MLTLLKRHGLAWLVWAVILWGFYLVLMVPTLPGVELAVGVGIAGLAATAAVAIRAQGLLDYRVTARGLPPLWRVPLLTVRDFGTLTLVLARRLTGSDVEGAFRWVPFSAARSAAETRARRALVTVAGTVAPNTIVVAIDPERHRMLLHELVPDESGGGPL